MTSSTTSTRRATAGARVVAGRLPVARVAVDVSLAHLDRTFDYQVAESDSAAAQPGTRVRVRFSGRLVDGYLLERAESSEHDGRLAFVERVVSAEPFLTPDVARLARAVADRYAGSMADVLRLAVPPRHARTENAARPPGQEIPPRDRVVRPVDRTRWQQYGAGEAFLSAIRQGRAVRAVWQALPG